MIDAFDFAIIMQEKRKKLIHDGDVESVDFPLLEERPTIKPIKNIKQSTISSAIRWVNGIISNEWLKGSLIAAFGAILATIFLLHFQLIH